MRAALKLLRKDADNDMCCCKSSGSSLCHYDAANDLSSHDQLLEKKRILTYKNNDVETLTVTTC